MARPRQFDRQGALELAMNDFWQLGYSAVSIKSLCEKLAISRSSFYNSFGSLEQLFAEAMALYLSHSPMQCLADTSLPANQAIRLFFQRLCKIRARDTLHRGCLIINNLSETDSMPASAARDLHDWLEQGIESLQQAIERAIDEGLLSHKTNSRIVALSLQTLATGINTLSIHVHNEKELWQVADKQISGLGL